MRKPKCSIQNPLYSSRVDLSHEKKNSRDKTLLTSRFARKQKKYFRIIIVSQHFGHFWLPSTHKIMTTL